MAPNRTTTPSQRLHRQPEDRYLELVRQFPLRPLRTNDDLNAAAEVVDSLIDQARLTAAEHDYLDVLSDIVEAYEAKAVRLRPVGDAEMLRFLIEGRQLTQTDVAKQAGIAESITSEVLAGTRKLNRAQIGKLARYFRVEPGAFSFGEQETPRCRPA